MFVLAVDPLMRAESGNVFDGNAPVTVSHGSLLSRRFHHENIILLRVAFQIVHFSAAVCCSQLLPDVFQPLPSDHPSVIPKFAVSFLSPFLLLFHLLHNRTCRMT